MQTVLFFSLLSAVSLEDIRHREISNWLNGCIAALILLDFQAGNLWGLLPAAVLFIAAMGGGIGGGDVKLAAACGLVLGLSRALWGMVLGLSALILFHLCASMVFHFRGRKGEKAYPLAPFLALGYVAVYYWK